MSQVSLSLYCYNSERQQKMSVECGGGMGGRVGSCGEFFPSSAAVPRNWYGEEGPWGRGRPTHMEGGKGKSYEGELGGEEREGGR